MKTRILFMVINMNVGGTEKALLNMIEEMPEEKYDITILMLEEYGGFLKSIPRRVQVKYLEGYKDIKSILNQSPHLVTKELLKEKKIIECVIYSFLYLGSKALKERSILYKYIFSKYPISDEKYDIAVAYAGPMDIISYFIAHKIRARKKIQWIHFDVTKIGFSPKFACKIYSHFDKVFIVSEEAKSKLNYMIPSIKDKSEVFFNIISSKNVRSQSREGIGFQDQFDGLRILTVGRLTREKGQDFAIKVLARLISEGYDVRWYCIGDGDLRDYYEKLIEEYNVKDHFILLGTEPNPYPYISQCDIYVQPSRYEGYCITTIEARCLNKPIVTTDVNGAREQIENGKTGLVVEIKEEAIYRAVKKLIESKSLRHNFAANLGYEKFDPTQELAKLYKIC